MEYVSRAAWGHPAAGTPGGYRIGQVAELIVHHSYRPHVDPGTPQGEVEAAVLGIWDHHVNTNGWDDIGYQWLVDQDGRVFEGRGWFQTGAHTEGRNSGSVGVCILIDGDRFEPTPAAWAAAARVVAEGVEVGALSPDYTVSGHTDYAGKSCPGHLTYPQIGRLEGADAADDFEEFLMSLPKEERRALERFAEQLVRDGVDGQSYARELLRTHRAIVPFIKAVRGMDTSLKAFGQWGVAALRELKVRGLREVSPDQVAENREHTPDELGIEEV